MDLLALTYIQRYVSIHFWCLNKHYVIQNVHKMLVSLCQPNIIKERVASLWAVTDNKIIEGFSMG